MIVTASATCMPLPDNSVACAVFSPPYNCNIPYRGYDDNMPWGEYFKLAENVAAELRRVLIPDGRVWCNVQHVVPSGVSPERLDLLSVWSKALNYYLDYRDTIAWVQDSHDGGTQWGSWLSPAAPNLRGGWEAIAVFYKDSWHRETPPHELSRKQDRIALGGDWTDLCRNVWSLPPERDRARSPAAFPIELPARAIRLSTWPGELVLDPFGGSGTTSEAAKLLGRNCVSLEISPAQCVVAAERLNTLF